MIGEFSLYGIYAPWILILTLLSLACSAAVNFLLSRLGFYRWVWHPALFDFAVFVIILGSFTFLLPK
jgi:hypothetical protein